jgi:CubicO group peptidase (beta-lactamase class C family)
VRLRAYKTAAGGIWHSRGMRCAITVCLVLSACGGSKLREAGSFAGIEQAIARGDAPKTTSVLVMRGAKIAYEHYFADATAETLHDTRSATKSLTAMTVGIAVERKLLPGVTAPAFGYLGDLAPFVHDEPLKQAITIEDFLTMSSALDCDDNDDSSPGNEENMYPKEVWARWVVDLPVRANYQRDASGRGPWHYCTVGTFLLGQIVQRAAKQGVDQFMAQQLLAPLGIARWEFSKSPSGEVMTGGGLRLRTRDLAKLGRMMLDHGAAGGVQVVPAGFVAAALTAHREALQDQEYGYLFWRHHYQTPCGAVTGWQMSGNGGNVVVMLAELDAVIVVTRTNYSTRGMHQQTAKLIEEQILPTLKCAK